ncbi:hypothetical protein CAPTEDRAFT_220106 [Capitella teleta]|uniref:Uncharacterized protein n=1 Tax=Capitella teleta TaxID=283909 RepID=R7TAK3_CAPTE|nr:hypothetical protein CAPTEDRAFT_220106 [Capitella teleta]|eukprot:ELT90527.1 hypothetical protein CAPTEDRAFT_220106 [Capitella teleta]
MQNISEKERALREELVMAVGYTNVVKCVFADKREVFLEFLEIFTGIRSGRNIKYAEAMLRVTELFDGYPHLVKHFERFLPPDYCREIETKDPFKWLDFRRSD